MSIGSEWEESTASTGTVVTATHIYRNLSTSTEEDGKILASCSKEYILTIILKAEHRGMNTRGEN